MFVPSYDLHNRREIVISNIIPHSTFIHIHYLYGLDHFGVVVPVSDSHLIHLGSNPRYGKVQFSCLSDSIVFVPGGEIFTCLAPPEFLEYLGYHMMLSGAKWTLNLQCCAELQSGTNPESCHYQLPKRLRYPRYKYVYHCKSYEYRRLLVWRLSVLFSSPSSKQTPNGTIVVLHLSTEMVL
jgi:hypothetical protein